MVRKILKTIPRKILTEDLERYRQLAINLGATDAKIITTNEIMIDERVRAKCEYPRCLYYGSSANCPPYTMNLDLVRKIVRKYKYAIFTRLEIPSDQVAGQDARDEKRDRPSQIKNREIVSKIESEAFFDGYYLALGFADGPCKKAFCPDKECSALIPGQFCRHPLRSRPAMEGVGMDVFAMATRIGWDVYPIAASLSPSQVPFGSKFGLILVH
jgi:predicted metal-binding protein